MILLNKPITKTPLEMLHILREQKPGYADVKLAYAGRLDPMARGLLVVLEGDECKRRDNFQNLDKTYEFEILFGFETDTYDLLGLVNQMQNLQLKMKNFEQLADTFTGTQQQTLPVYSSQTVQGKPLFWWAREGRLDETEIPTKKVTISSLKFQKIIQHSSEDILARIQKLVPQVKGDFRQNEIVERWQTLLQGELAGHTWTIAKASADVTSGTYIRSLAHDMGKALGTHAIAWDINRTRVGEFVIEDAIDLT